MRLSLWMCVIICSLFVSFSTSTSSSHNSSLCHPHDSSTLLHFKHSFSFINRPYYRCENNYNKTVVSWKNGTDCCTWSGVTCDKMTGNVIKLNLYCSQLQGIIHPNTTLFLLRHLRSLDLSHNHFQGSQISANFGSFTGLKHLNLNSSSFSGQVPREISYLSELLTLDLSNNDDLTLETSSLQRVTTNLTNLKVLDLSITNLFSAEPGHSLMNLSSSLTSLVVSVSRLQGKLPQSIFLLPKLQVLDLEGNENLTGSFPKSNRSSPIRELSLSGTAFSIDMSYVVRNLKFVNGLYLSSCTFVGSYPSLEMVANLSKLTSLDLSFNNLNGHIPWNIFLNLQPLIRLLLSYNNFVGQLPETCTNYANQICFSSDSLDHQLLGHVPMNLEYLDLSYNELNGIVPSWLYSLPVLEELDLSYNQFIGTIQEFQSTSLVLLHLGGNKLHGPIPVSLFQQKNLFMLDLSYTNLSLSFNDLDNYTFPHLFSLKLSSCNISEFPYFLRASEFLYTLDLSQNKIQGSIPKWLWNVGVDALGHLNLSYNLLSGYLPEQLPWKNLYILDLRSNLIHGHLPIPPPIIGFYFISKNQLFGEIPSLICTLTSIVVLDLSHNTLNGSIPLCLGNLSYRYLVLDLRMNMFDGTIPTTFSKGNSLENIGLNGNRLKGPLPRALLNCRNLEILDLGNNMINDTFPWWLESLPNLQVLILRSNKFHGSLASPNVRFSFQSLRIMDLSNNNFSGLLPAKYFEHFMAMMHNGHMDQLRYMGNALYQDSVVVTMKGLEMELEHILNIFTTIDFSKNNFVGEIPKSVGNLISLQGLNLSHNKIFGSIPTSLGNLTNLEWLDLSSNYLSGEIPMQLIEITWLSTFNVSQNHLAGAIPHGKQFNTFRNDSYIGNLGLCGFPLTKTCGDNPTQQPSPSVIDHHSSRGFKWI